MPNIFYVVHKVCQFMSAHTDSHYTIVKHILRYLKATTNHGLHINHSSSFSLHRFTNVDGIGSINDYKSTSGYLVYLSITPIS